MATTLEQRLADLGCIPAGNAVKHFQAVEFRWSC